MTKYMTVRLTPWAAERIAKDYGSVSKKSLRQSLRDFPGTEFHTVATPDQPRDGAVVTVAEAHDAMVDVLEVRFNNDRSVAMVTIRGDQVVVS